MITFDGLHKAFEYLGEKHSKEQLKRSLILRNYSSIILSVLIVMTIHFLILDAKNRTDINKKTSEHSPNGYLDSLVSAEKSHLLLPTSYYEKTNSKISNIEYLFIGYFVFFLLTVPTFIWFYNYSRRRMYLPIRARDYLNQKYLFYDSMTSTEPFVLVLRSFEQARYLQEKSQNENKYFKTEPDYEDNTNVYERIEKAFELPVKLIYVGGSNNCCTKNRLTKSIFLIAKENWINIVEDLMEKSLIIVLMPGNSKGLIKELNLILQNRRHKTYFLSPFGFDKNSQSLKNWIKTYDDFTKIGLNIPYENRSKLDCFFDMSTDILEETSIEKVFNKHLSFGYNATGHIIYTLRERKYISTHYLKECLKSYDVRSYIKESDFYTFFSDAFDT